MLAHRMIADITLDVIVYVISLRPGCHYYACKGPHISVPVTCDYKGVHCVAYALFTNGLIIRNPEGYLLPYSFRE